MDALYFNKEIDSIIKSGLRLFTLKSFVHYIKSKPTKKANYPISNSSLSSGLLEYCKKKKKSLEGSKE